MMPVLRDIDMNLLVVLDVLLEEQSVTRAAQRLHRTQSAVSHSLARLRDLTGDELLIRDGRRMRPTRRGEALAESLPRVMDMLARTLDAPETFDAASTARTFRLAAPDFLGALMPALLGRLHADAPQARLELVSVDAATVRDVEEGRYDGLVAPESLDAEGLRSRVVGTSSWAVFGRSGHPYFAEPSVAGWAAWPHLQIRTGGRAAPVDGAARRAGVDRSIGAVVSHFAMAPAVLARTPLLLTVPRIALGDAVEAYGLASCPAPLDLAPLSLAVYRSARSGAEPGTRWFVERVEAVLRGALAGP